MAWSLHKTTFADPDITRKTKLSSSLKSFLGSCFTEASSSSVRSAGSGWPSRTSNSKPGCIGRSGSSCSNSRSVRSGDEFSSPEVMEASRRGMKDEPRGSIMACCCLLLFRFVSLCRCLRFVSNRTKESCHMRILVLVFSRHFSSPALLHTPFVNRGDDL
jgi:hypothetical protein